MKSIVAAAGLVICTESHAQMWSTYEDFYGGANPWGPWSYGWKTTPTGAITLFDRAFVPATGMPGWAGTTFPNDVPCVAANPLEVPVAVPGTTIIAPPCSSWFRPGPAAEWACFRFTPQTTGRYILNAFFRKIDPGNTSTPPVRIVIDGIVAFQATVPANGTMVSYQSGEINISSNNAIDFLLGPVAGGSSPAVEVEGYIELNPNPRCFANCDGSTGTPFLNINDFVCFLNLFASGDLKANCDGSYIIPQLNVHDFGCFLNRFAAGCTAP